MLQYGIWRNDKLYLNRDHKPLSGRPSTLCFVPDLIIYKTDACQASLEGKTINEINVLQWSIAIIREDTLQGTYLGGLVVRVYFSIKYHRTSHQLVTQETEIANVEDSWNIEPRLFF